MTEGQHQPQLLLATGDDAWADTIEGCFALQGYAVVRARSAAAALAQGARVRPAAIIAAHELPDAEGADLCQALRRAPWADAAIPIVLTTARELESGQRLDLLRAGAWDVLRTAATPEEVLLRVKHYTAAREVAVRAQEKGLVDPETGLYNEQGLLRRCEELVADAFRRHAALACLAVAPDVASTAASGANTKSLGSEVAHLLRTVRRSDVAGRHGPTEFVLLAPRTDPRGAVGLARRLAGRAAGARVRVGYDAVPNVHEVPTTAATLIRAACEALRRTSKRGRSASIQPFRPFEHRRPPDPVE